MDTITAQHIESIIEATFPVRDLILAGTLPDEVLDKLTEAIDSMDTACDLLMEAQHPQYAFLDAPPDTDEEWARWEQTYAGLYAYDTGPLDMAILGDLDVGVEQWQCENGH